MLYLFTARYADGTCYEQNLADVSTADPSRSCFYDVDQERLARFELRGHGHVYAVDLADGHFEVDGAAFRFHEDRLADYRLVFFRRHTHTFNAGHDEIRHAVVYRMGWQATDADGHNVQRVMEID